MAVIGFILRDEDNIWWRNLGEMVDACWDCVFGERELPVVNSGVAGKPWV